MADNEFYQVNLQFVDNRQVIVNMAEATAQLGNELEDMGKKANRAKGFLASLESRLFGQLAAASLAARAIRYVGRELKEFAEFDLNAPQFKENTQLAYATVLESAEKGKETFRTLDDIARRVHLPSERAHDIATHLMEQGLRDTSAIAQVIETSAALIRTGNEKGAEKLLTIIDRSIVRGHFGQGGRGGGRAARELAGLGISATLAKELASGKDTVEDGIGKISNAIQAGDIGKIARKKFDLKDFEVDVKNTFRKVAQDIDASGTNNALKRLDEAIINTSKDGGILNTVFQTTSNIFGWVIDRTTEFINGFDKLTSGLKDAFNADQDFVHGLEDLGPAINTVIGAAASFGAAFTVGVIEILQTAAVTAEEMGAALGFLADTLTHPFSGHVLENEKAYHKTVMDLHAGLMASLKKEDKLIEDFMLGNTSATHASKKAADHFYAEGKSLDYIADAAGKAKKAIDEILGPEDLVFDVFAGAADFSRVIEAGHKGPGFANLFGAGEDPHDYYSTFWRQGASQAAMLAPLGGGGSASVGGGGGSPATSPAAVGGRSVSLTWTGNVYVGQDAHMEAPQFREVMDHALIDALDRLRLELGA
jgi:hypothetical protein